jgi:ubiquinone/menaquinone biosynthesis C-methylase UbiE
MRRYDQSASVYDLQYAEEQGAKILAALADLELKDGSLILDVGCGTGLLFSHVAESASLLVGLDFSGLLRHANDRAKQFSNVALVRADAGFLPFQDRVFDVIFAVTLLQNLPSPLDALCEIARVAHREATIIVTGLKKEFSKEEFVQLLERTKLEISILNVDEHLRGYIAICVSDNSC